MFRGNILVVEKDSFYSSFYQKLLSQEGYQVFLTPGIEDALRLYRERNYDIIISDIVLQGQDGLSLLAEVRKISPHQAVIMITGMQSIKKAVEALKMGAADYLTKPVDAEELLLLIRNLIDRQNISDEHSRLVGENVLFFEQLRVQKRGLEVLSLLDTDRILDHFLDLITEETGAVWASLWFFSETDGQFSFAALRGMPDPRRDKPRNSFQTAALREQFSQGRAVLEDNQDRQYPEGSRDAIHSFRLPLLLSGRLTGLLAVGPRRDDKPHSHYQINIARVLAESGAIALQNARHFSLESARDLHDADTDTYSPTFFHQAGVKEVNVARRYGRPLSLVCVAFENYPTVKKNFKEAQARRLLKEFAEKITEVTRETDVLSMLEEGFFGIVTPETDYYGALMLIKRIKAGLRNAVFSLDLKRELRPVVSLGSSSHPRDGEQQATLLRRARERLIQDRNSLVRKLDLERRSFWKAFTHLLNQETGPAPDPSVSKSFLHFSDQEVDHIRNLFLDEAGRFGGKRGLIYIGMQKVDSTSFTYSGFSRLARTKFSIFALGAKGDGSWNHPEIAPVYLKDNHILQHRFLFCVSEFFYYTCLCRQEGPDRWRVFHTADPFVVQEMIGKLQERYLLQQRIG